MNVQLDKLNSLGVRHLADQLLVLCQTRIWDLAVERIPELIERACGPANRLRKPSPLLQPLEQVLAHVSKLDADDFVVEFLMEWISRLEVLAPSERTRSRWYETITNHAVRTLQEFDCMFRPAQSADLC